MTIPSPAILLTIGTLLPLASFLLLVFYGKKFGTPLAGIIGTLAIGASFVLSIVAMISWLGCGTYNGGVEWGAGKGPINLPIPFLPMGSGLSQSTAGFLDIGLYIDSLTIAMFSMVTLVSTLVHVFSIGYMREDARFPRFFTYLGLFCFSMLGLVIGGTILQLFIFWELVGLCSYLLIGFWYEKKSASNAAIKAFVTNRVGDFGFLIGLGILFYHLGNVSLPDLWIILGNAGKGGAITLSNGVVFSAGLLTVTGIGLFFGAVGKSAQFPLHVWLPDAMEGPTPVSALIHAATMVAAGVYLVGRIFPILTPDAKLFIAIIGCTTLVMAALIAIAQSDIKKVLAYSTLSQLGYMILAMGVGSWMGGLFHLITHAFFKALLFLGSGSVIHAAHHEQELPQYGGLWKKIPITCVTFGIAVLAIAGTPLLSGYCSKDTILAQAGAFAALSTHEGKSKAYWLLFILPAAIAYITPFYMMRCWTLTFLGKPRNQHVYDHAREHSTMWWPLVILAGFSLFGGYIGVQTLLRSAIKETNTYCQKVDPKFSGFQSAWQTFPLPGEYELNTSGQGGEVSETAPHAKDETVEKAVEEGEHVVKTYVFWAFIVGMGLGLVMYIRGYAIANVLMKIPPVRWIHTWLYRRMYFDELYQVCLIGLTMGISRLCGLFDKYVVDGLVNLVGWIVRQTSVGAGLSDHYVVDGAVNGAADLAQRLGAVVRTPQTGRIRVYVTILLVTVTLGLAAAIFVTLR